MHLSTNLKPRPHFRRHRSSPQHRTESTPSLPTLTPLRTMGGQVSSDSTNPIAAEGVTPDKPQRRSIRRTIWHSIEKVLGIHRHKPYVRLPAGSTTSLPSPCRSDLREGQAGPSSTTPPVARRPPNHRDTYMPARSTIWHGCENLLVVASDAADAFPPLKSALGGVIAILKTYNRYSGNKEKALDMINRLESFEFLKLGIKDDTNELARRHKLQKALERILEDLQRIFDQNKIERVANSTYDDQKLSSHMEDIRIALTDYQMSLQHDLYKMQCEMIDKVDLLHLEKLPRAKDAGHLSGNRQKCLRNTRKILLRDIRRWADDDKTRHVFWLNGVAGSGKSTIAQSFAEFCFAEGRLGSCFFCSRDFLDRSNIHLIFPTLAFDLAYRYPEFRAAIIPTIMSSPNVGHESLSVQLEKFLIGPLKSTGLSTVIIIDALDECKDDEPASVILSLLARHIDEIPLVKFFITGRPEPRIRSGFRLPLLKPHTEVLHLHEVDPGSVNQDIEIFLRARLSEIATHRSDLHVELPWPQEREILILVRISGGLFIIASTTCRFVESTHANPQSRLQLITSLPDSTPSDVDPFYSRILNESYANVGPNSSDIFRRLQVILGAIVVVFNPVSRTTLASLLDMNSGDIFTTLRPLHSVLLVPESAFDPVRAVHKSFPDYLTEIGRCTDANFHVDTCAHHTKLAICCLKLMNTRLKKNICGLSRYAMNRDVGDLPTRRRECIGDAMEYACRFWAKHLRSASKDDVWNIIDSLKYFIQHQLLKWLEVLSIVDDLRGAILSLIDVEEWLVDIKVCDGALLTSVRESQRFVLYSFDCIQESIPHMYESALLWPPKSSDVRAIYNDQLPTQVKLLNAVDTSWDACIRSSVVGDRDLVKSVAFSHKGHLIAGCGGHVAQIFEAATGVCLATFDANDGNVNSVAFSPDDLRLASGSRNTIRIWDIETGGLFTSLEGHTDSVYSVAFSPCGIMLASGAGDKTIRIWGVSSGQCEHILEGHSGHVQSVCWLGTKEVVSGSHDLTVKVWEVPNGVCKKTFHDHTHWVHSVASSPDATKFASGSEDKTIKIYDACTGDVLKTIPTDCSVASICFSPCGNKIAYGTDHSGPSLFVWDMVEEVIMLKCRAANVSSVVFAPNGSCVASGSSGFVKVWQIETGNQAGDGSDQHTEKVFCVSFAVDGQLIASGSMDETVKVWDATTGKCLHTFWGHSGPVRSVSFSDDSSLIASASTHAILIWSVQDHSVIGSLKGHAICTIALSPDNARLAVVWENTITLLDMRDGTVIAASHSEFWFPSDPPRVSFDADGTRLILEYGGKVEMWDIRLCSELTGSDSLPLMLILVPEQGIPTPHNRMLSQPYRYPEETEWILDEQDRRICWIPADRRGCASDFHGSRVVLGTSSGRVIMLDLSDVRPS